MRIDSDLQAQVDAQLLEQGAFGPLELLLDSGRLAYEDYERWRRGEIDALDSVLMGDAQKIRGELERTAEYARSIGLVQQPRELFAWRSRAEADASRSDKPLRASANAMLNQLIGVTYVRAQNVPQMDLFFDNPVVALATGIVRALSAQNVVEAQRQLDRLYAQAPNHADLPGFDRLVAGLKSLDRTVDDPARELDFLLEATPTAKHLLGAQARDFLSPLWRQLAEALAGQPFAPETPGLHRSFALSQAQDWPHVTECVLAEAEWWRHAPLCLRLTHASFYRQRRAEGLMAWCYLCWCFPEQASGVLERRAHPDAAMAALWQRFLDGDDDAESALTAADFPAWLLLREPGLVLQLPQDLPKGETPGEEHYRLVHRWIQARRAGRGEEEMNLRRMLQAAAPALFRELKRAV